MKFTISPNRYRLTITVDETERQQLRELGETVHQDATMHDFLEPLTCNSELEWINPADTGDLTDAPMLGILGSENTIEGIERLAKGKPGICGSRLCGHWDGKDRHQPILERWAFMDYQVRSVLEDFRDKGEAVFVNGA